MNFSIYQRIIALPLSTAENSIAGVLAYHVQKDVNSCFPSYKTIKKESGASNKTISKVIRTLKYAGVIDFKHRAQIGTNDKAGGKESNEYFFLFDDIGFYRNKLSKDNTALFHARIKEARIKATKDMEAESVRRKLKNNPTIPSQMLRKGKSQNVKNDVCNVAGLRGATIPSHFTPNTSQMLRRSNRDNVQPINDSTSNDTTKELRNSKKTVRHDEHIGSISTNNQDLNTVIPAKKKTPSQQSNDEWLNDFDSIN